MPCGKGHEKMKTPLRIPQDVPIGRVDPPFMTAGSLGTLHLILELPKPITGDALVLWLGGHRWVKLDTICQNEDPAAEGYVSARILDGPILEAVPRPPPERIHELMRVAFRIPEGGIPPRSKLEFLLGDVSKGSAGIKGPRFYARNVFFPLTLEPKPSSLEPNEFNWIGAFILDFLGGPLDHLRVLAPSQVRTDERFSLTVRPQDRLGNISPNFPQHLVVNVNGQIIERRINRKDLNPAGAMMIDGLSINQKGLFRISVEDPVNNLRTKSNPIRVGGQVKKLYWGLIHEHTEVSDGAGSLDLCYENMRYGSRMDFGATSDHDHRFETTDEMWEMTKEAMAHFNDSGKFTTLLGYEWAKWRRNGDGDRNVYYPGEEGAMYRSETGEYDTPKKLFDALKGKDALIIPHHTAYTGNFCDWSQHKTDKERLVEIYSVWGNSEMAASRGNPLPVRTARAFNPKWVAISGEKPSLGEEPVGFVQNALEQGWRVGFTAGVICTRATPEMM